MRRGWTAGLLLVGTVLIVGANDAADDPPIFTPPASQPAASDRPPNPFGNQSFNRKDAIPGYVEFSNGQLAVGKIFTTRDKPLRLYERSLKRFLPIPLRSISKITGHLEWAREEPQWRWKEMGSDDKLYSGLSYPVLKVYYTFTLLDGRSFTGDCQVQPFYVATKTEQRRYILWQRHKGELGQVLADLRYVKEAHFGLEAMERGLKMLQGDPKRVAGKQEGEPSRDRPPVFVGDPEDNTVHRHTCRRAAKIPLPAAFQNLKDAHQAGYAICTECKPEPHKLPTTRPAPRTRPSLPPRGGFVEPNAP